MVSYKIEDDLSTADFINILQSSKLCLRGPYDDESRLQIMLEQADIIYVARDGGTIVGISRAITDFSYCCYLADLAVDEKYQDQGIGKELLRLTHEKASLQTTLILFASPDSQNYYSHIGMESVSNCFIIPKQ